MGYENVKKRTRFVTTTEELDQVRVAEDCATYQELFIKLGIPHNITRSRAMGDYKRMRKLMLEHRLADYVWPTYVAEGIRTYRDEPTARQVRDRADHRPRPQFADVRP